ncbi:MAG: flagellar biosynthesis anti-sigma factor FlgM [Candidatus Latescibacteria bacterium]|nr:flagellar biosynthesis anti-sigma factor FlgM [Candidatus Latescibacterota bacterium]
MNIQDVGNNAGSVRTDQVNVQTKPAETKKIRDEITTRQEQAEESRDEYVGSIMNIMKSASYSVSDVRQGKVDELRARIREGNYNPSGEKIAQKLVDMILATGRKSLKVYRIES